MNGLTEQEQLVMDNLIKSFQAFLALPRQHPDEIRDFTDGIHKCQDQLAVRICRRLYPKGWTTYHCDHNCLEEMGRKTLQKVSPPSSGERGATK